MAMAPTEPETPWTFEVEGRRWSRMSADRLAALLAAHGITDEDAG